MRAILARRERSRLTWGGFSETTRVFRDLVSRKGLVLRSQAFSVSCLSSFDCRHSFSYIGISSSIACSQSATSLVKAKVPFRPGSLKTRTPTLPRALALRKAAELGKPKDFQSAEPVRNGPEPASNCSASSVPDVFEAIVSQFLCETTFADWRACHGRHACPSDDYQAKIVA